MIGMSSDKFGELKYQLSKLKITVAGSILDKSCQPNEYATLFDVVGTTVHIALYNERINFVEGNRSGDYDLSPRQSGILLKMLTNKNPWNPMDALKRAIETQGIAE